MKVHFFWKNFYLTVTTLITATFVATVAMIGVYSFSSESIKLHVARSLDIYITEQNYFRYAPLYPSSQLDNFTDAIMLSTAMYPSKSTIKNIIEDSMLNPRYGHNDYDPPVSQLINSFLETDASKMGKIEYPRYWHGYLIFLKPLLLIFTMSDIRMLNIIIQLFLLCLLLIQLHSVGKYKLSIPFLAGILVLNPVSCALSMQYATLYYITLVSSLLLLKYKLYLSTQYWYFFLVIGICTAFFDLLTYPLISLGFPLILFILLNNEKSFLKMKKVIFCSISWGIGYFGMWLNKWSIASLLTKSDVLADAYKQVQFRLHGQVGFDKNLPVTFTNVLLRNSTAFYNNINILFLDIMICLLIATILIKHYKVKVRNSIIIPLFCVATYPFIWSFIIKNHTLAHAWFTYRIFSITILAVIYAIVYSLNKEQNRN